jgi:hypothetical protein
MLSASLRAVFVSLASVALIALSPGMRLLAEEKADQGDRLLAEGLLKIWAGLTTGPNRPLTDEEAQELIVKLGDPRFAVREQAFKRFVAMPFPPLTKLTAATRHPDQEIAERARKILARIETRSEPEHALLEQLFRTLAARKVRLELHDFKRIIAVCEQEPMAGAAQEAFVAAMRPDDLPTLKTMIAEEKNSRVRAAAVRGWITLSRDDITPELRKLLEDPDMAVRSAAALALIRKGQEIDFKKYLDKLDGEAKVVLYREAEAAFRRAHRADRKDPKVYAEHQQLTAAYLEALTNLPGVTREKKPAARTPHWIDLGMDTSKHPEVVAYKVRWFSGAWSAWLVPGYNDPMEDGRKLRLWACFNDHEYEVITTLRKDLQRIVIDVP